MYKQPSFGYLIIILFDVPSNSSLSMNSTLCSPLMMFVAPLRFVTRMHDPSFFDNAIESTVYIVCISFLMEYLRRQRPAQSATTLAFLGSHAGLLLFPR